MTKTSPRNYAPEKQKAAVKPLLAIGVNQAKPEGCQNLLWLDIE